jgi:predicted nucleic-acid-binding Zn-ribbon protein
VLLIRSDVKVAIPHFLGGKEETNATFFTELFSIVHLQFLKAYSKRCCYSTAYYRNCQVNWPFYIMA